VLRAIRKQGLKVGIIASSSLLILAMGSAFASAKVTKSAAAIPKLHWKGTITMYAASYTPVVPGEKLAKDSIRLTELETLAKQFEKMYPGITIKFIPKFTDSDQQVETMSAGGTMYDVYWNLYQNWNAVFPFLIASVIGIFMGAAMLAVGHNSNRGQTADKGKTAIIASLVAAVITGAAVIFINFGLQVGAKF